MPQVVLIKSTEHQSIINQIQFSLPSTDSLWINDTTMLTATRSALSKTATMVARSTNPAISWNLATRALSVAGETCHLQALCNANSQVLQDQIHVLDSLIERKHGDGANKIYKAECPVVGSTMGKQIRHCLDHLEKVALDGLHTVRENDEPIDLRYDVRERGTICETDIFEARQRAIYVKDLFDSVYSGCVEEGNKLADLDGKKGLTATFNLPYGARDDIEIPLSSTLEREMGFCCHHAIHHHRLLRAMAAAGRTGLKPEDLPPAFGRPPSTLSNDFQDAA